MDGTWVYPPLAEEMVEEDIQEVETYVARLNKTTTQHIATRLIMDLCLLA